MMPCTIKVKVVGKPVRAAMDPDCTVDGLICGVVVSGVETEDPELAEVAVDAASAVIRASTC